MSITGGIGIPGGEGVVYSPTSTERSATMPSKGAWITVSPCSREASSIPARACSTPALEARQAAAAVSADVWA